MTLVRVYEKENCVQCVQTKRLLDAKGIRYVVEDITVPETLAAMKKLNHMSAPVVVVGEESWAGFRPDKIDELVKRLELEEGK